MVTTTKTVAAAFPSAPTRVVAVNGISMNVAETGAGPPLLLLHGFPHTWELWSSVIPELSRHHRVIAPDLRGLGATTKVQDGCDAATLADDAAALLTALGADQADIVAIDAGVPGAFLLALERPERVRRLVLTESLLGRLPGAEDFLAAGAPWWFGFHAVPGLAETIVEGHEREYIEWFLTAGTAGRAGIPDAPREAFVAAYTGTDALRSAFAHYRAIPTSALQIEAAVAVHRLRVPTLAVAGGVVGDALRNQLHPIADQLTAITIEDCGHIVPLEQPAALLEAVLTFLRATEGDRA